MADPRGFLTVARRRAPLRPAGERVRDHRDVHAHWSAPAASAQASRCMGCGVPFCHTGCPLGNLIPDFNDLVHRGRWEAAAAALHRTNNFPEFTGAICPAPCEEACVLSVNDEPVTIEDVEREIAERAWRSGWVRPAPPARESGRRVAVVGSGPAGLAAAQQLRRAGHAVTVYERDDRPGGLLRYGIPDFKLEKRVVDRRLRQLMAEGVAFRTGVEVGADVAPADLGAEAIVLCLGAPRARELPLPGRELRGVHLAMEYLVGRNRAAAGDRRPELVHARGRHVVVIGGGDTGADCVGWAHRDGAASVTQLAHGPRPPESRDPVRTWPDWPWLLRTYPAHEEGGAREWLAETERLAGVDGHVRRLEGRRVGAGMPFSLPADLVLVAVGFAGAERSPLLSALGLDLDARGRVPARAGGDTASPGVFAAGDCVRGADLVVTAIADGRAAAAAVERHLRARAA